MDQKTDWKIEWVIRIILLVFLIAAVAGMFGGHRSPRRLATSDDHSSLEVRYWPVMRPGHRMHLAAVVRNRGDATAEQVTLRFNRHYFRAFDVQGILPEPESQAATQNELSLTYGPLSPGEDLEVQIDLYVHRWGRYRGQVQAELAGVDSEPIRLDFATTVIP